MDKSCWKLAQVVLVMLISTNAEALFSCHMEDFIKAVKQVEDQDPGSEPLAVLKKLRRAAGLNDAFIQNSLGNDDTGGSELDRDLSNYIWKVVHHRVLEDAREEGLVLTPDGTTVALGPLLLGLEAGYSKIGASRLCQLTLAKDLGLALGSPEEHRFGPDGCWDNLTFPQVFTLSGKPSLLTTAQVNGGMDGVILGTEISADSRGSFNLSSLLKDYYSQQLGGKGMDGAPRLISRRRRENFRALTPPSLLARHVGNSVNLRQTLEGHAKMTKTTKRQLVTAIKKEMKQFVHMYMDCPPFIARCMWGAEPYRGTPTNLTLPLSFMYIHHTSTPSEPCLTFEQCSADMRSMQRFHQEDRGWDDIGYSFVAGSDGYIYEGRGWYWQGAHTYGHNSKGYGVSFIGDYSTRLPSQHSMGLVRDQLASCAIEGGRLVSSFTVQGHRQVVNTSCPGDAFYQEIKGWERFGEVKN